MRGTSEENKNMNHEIVEISLDLVAMGFVTRNNYGFKVLQREIWEIFYPFYRSELACGLITEQCVKTSSDGSINGINACSNKHADINTRLFHAFTSHDCMRGWRPTNLSSSLPMIIITSQWFMTKSMVNRIIDWLCNSRAIRSRSGLDKEFPWRRFWMPDWLKPLLICSVDYRQIQLHRRSTEKFRFFNLTKVVWISFIFIYISKWTELKSKLASNTLTVVIKTRSSYCRGVETASYGVPVGCFNFFSPMFYRTCIIHFPHNDVQFVYILRQMQLVCGILLNVQKY